MTDGQSLRSFSSASGVFDHPPTARNPPPSFAEWRKTNVELSDRPPAALSICCCFTFILLLAIGSLVTSAVYLLKPPGAAFGGVDLPANAVSIGSDKGLSLTFDAKVDVHNPNVIGAYLPSLVVSVFAPGDNTTTSVMTDPIAHGHLEDIKILARAITNISMPFSVHSTSSLKPLLALLADAAQDCKVVGQNDPSPPQLSIPYSVNALVRVLGITISINVNGEAAFPCDLKLPDLLANALKAAGLDSLSNIINTVLPDSGGDLVDSALKGVSALIGSV